MKLQLLALLAWSFALAQTPPSQMPTGPFVSPWVTSVKSSNYTVTAADFAQNTMLILTSPVTISVPQAGTTGFEVKRSMLIVNASSGTVTVNTTTSQFLGGGFNATTATLSAGQSMIIASGANSGTPIWGTALLNLGSGGGAGDSWTAAFGSSAWTSAGSKTWLLL